MKKLLSLLFFIYVNFYFVSLHAEESLTIKQQLDRIMQEVSDLNRAVFNKSFDNKNLNNSNNAEDTERFTSIDIRIYDLEKDIKNLTLQFEETMFKLEDISKNIQNLESQINVNIEKLNNLSAFENIENNTKENLDATDNEEENTLGKLVLTEDIGNKTKKEENILEELNVTQESKINDLPPEEQLQFALDQMMKKNYEKSKTVLEEFIENFPNNQLSGSAHYWLGKINLFESNYRKAAIVFGEGVQKFPKSIKAAEMYYELSKSLIEMNKISEACKTLALLDQNYKGNKFANDPEKIKDKLNCQENN